MLYMSLFLHQTTTCSGGDGFRQLLYMSLFLHQTTTQDALNIICGQLYMSLFLHQTTTADEVHSYDNRLYMSLFLHQTTTRGASIRCLASCICLYSYIKPQLKPLILSEVGSCICLYSYIKPQLRFIIVLYFNQLGYYHRLRSGPLMRDSSAKLLKKL